MNSGMPNTSKALAKIVTRWFGLTGFLAILAEKVFEYFGTKESKEILIIADETHVGIIVPKEGAAWESQVDRAYQVVDSGVQLTEEQKDEIDNPVMADFRKLATFRVRKPNGKSP